MTIPTPEAERFWPKVQVTGFCWIWTASLTRDGYGKFSLAGGGWGMAHRWAYEELVGPIPEALVIDHLCRIRNCVNPDHLEPVTPALNAGRSVPANKTHCKSGHPLSGANLSFYGRGGRRCLACCRESTRRYMAKKEAA